MLAGECLHPLLAGQPALTRLIVAYSGGRDSHVLLHRLASDVHLRSRYRLQALHVDHGLQNSAADWAEHCARVCRGLDIAFGCLAVDARPAPGDSPEAAARRARYRALAALLDSHTAVLTAHHRGDQAETVLLNLLRGSGPRGLAAMPTAKPLGRGWLLRPLLGCGSALLADYAQRHALVWIEDPSNADERFERNLLRRRIVPRLRAHWPALEQTLSRAADHAAETSALLEQLAGLDLARLGAEGDSIDLAALQSLNPARQRNVLRHWLRALHLPVPDQRRLQQVLTDLLPAARDRQPRIDWPGAELRRYRNRLYAMRPLPPLPTRAIEWTGETPLPLPDGSRLRLIPRTGQGLEPLRLVAPAIHWRRGGERFHPQGRRHGQALKKLLQDAGLPPWERERLPLLYCGGQLAAVPGIGVARELAVSDDATGLVLEWQKTDGSVTLSCRPEQAIPACAPTQPRSDSDS